MIGQEKLRNELMYLYKNNKLSKTNILIAPKGYGKKEFIKWFSEQVSVTYQIFDGTIDSIREAIEKSRQEFISQIYVFENIDKSKISQNALLKFIEEPPINIFNFILCENKNLLLPTILNRGNVFEFENYKLEELKKFNENELALKIFKNPKDLINAEKTNLDDLLNITNKIVEKLDCANVSNALKLNTYIKIKEEDKGYDLDMFVTALKHSFVELYKEKRDTNIIRKFNILINSLSHLKFNNSKYFMDNFVLNNFLEVKNGSNKV